MMTAPKIAIIGGGPAGLTLGLLLKTKQPSIQFTIFELRPKPTPEELLKPSGMLDLHEKSGLAALKECGLYESFLKLTGECSEAQRVSDKDGNIVYADEGELSARPEISRHALTGLLTRHLDEGCVRYGHKLLSVSCPTHVELESEEQGIQLDFGPNGIQTFDLVIGADGAWSRVRSAVTNTKPSYTRTQSITATISDIGTRYPHLESLIGKGSFSALGHRHGVMAQRGPGGCARIYTFLSIPDEHFPETEGLDTMGFQNAKERLLTDENLIGGFGEKIKGLVSAAWEEEFASTNECIAMRPLYTLPTNAAAVYPSHTKPITLLGDAAHLMPPWAGEGVNLAMWDSLSLSKAISTAFEKSQAQPHEQHQTFTSRFLAELNPLLRAFEKEMFDRALEKAEETVRNGEMLFGEDGAVAFKRFFEGVYGAYEG